MSVAVLGGGVSGLASAFYLKNLNKNLKIILIEGTDRLGGWIKNHVTTDGTQFEIGPRSLRVSGLSGANTLQLAESLDLIKKIRPIHASNPAAQNRLIKVDENLHILPSNLKAFFKHQKPFSKSLFRLALKDLSAPKCNSTDDSMYNFADRRFGTEIAKYIIDPMCRGIFAGNAKELSINSLAKRLFDIEHKYQSVIKGLILDSFKSQQTSSVESELVKRANGENWSIWSFEGGLSTLVNTLESEIENDVEIYRNCKVLKIDQDDNKLILSNKDHSFAVDKVISCIPANQLQPLLTNVNNDVAQLLGSIPFVDVAVVNLEYDGNIIKQPGFGYLIPSSQPSKVLGVIYDSVLFPQKTNRTVVTVMMGGYWFDSLFGKNPSLESLLDIARQEVETTLGVSTDISLCSHKVSILRNCIPQYTVGHSERIAKARQILENTNIPLYLAGNSYDGIGINDSILNCKNIVSAMS